MTKELKDYRLKMLNKEKILDIIGYSMIQNSQGIFLPKKEEDITVSIQYNEPEIDIIEAIENGNKAVKLMEESINQFEREIEGEKYINMLKEIIIEVKSKLHIDMEELVKKTDEKIFQSSMIPFFLTDFKIEPMVMCNPLKPVLADYHFPILPLSTIDEYEIDGYKKLKKKKLFLKIFCIKCFKKRKILKRNFKNKVIKCKKCGGYIKKIKEGKGKSD